MKKLSLAFLAFLVTSLAFAQPCSKPFFSEYIEGTGTYNKVLEIYNPTLVPVNLSGYKIQIYFNGSTTPATNISLSGTIAPGDVYVIANRKDSLPAPYNAQVDTSNGTLTFNGDDAIALLNGTDTLDIIGVIGNDPGLGWPITPTDSTQNRTLVRKASVNQGTKNWTVGSTQWDAYSTNDFTHLGSHTMNPCTPPADTLVNMASASATVSESIGSYSLMVTLNQIPKAPKTVDVVMIGGANGGNASDVSFTTATATFAANSSSATVSIPIVDDAIAEGAEEIFFRLRNPSAGLVLGADSVFTLTIALNDSITPAPVIPFYKIAQVHGENANGIADSTGVKCRVGGVVYGINYRKSGLGFYIHDHTAGIYVYSGTKKFGYTVTEGDSVHVQGTISQNIGALNVGFTQIIVSLSDTVIKISSGNGLLEPEVVTGALSEAVESHLVRVNGLTYKSGWTNSGSGFTVQATNGTNYFIRIDSLTTAYTTPAPSVNCPFDVIGLVSQYDTSSMHNGRYTINVRSAADIIRCVGIEDLHQSLAAVVYPNPAKDKLTVSVNLEQTSPLTMEISNLAGEVVMTNTQLLYDGQNRLQYHLPNLSNGIYLVTLRAANKVMHSKLTITK